ncbi:ciliary rootlet coiled-coil protein 2-like [Phycodurus eques]|uniref:ciliary rootlet coiled-coil protein 2-like n=1 Tax=Phycodurus eques TaxID=693459 RepID=UPI002ACE413F|nr:ciliary rootlet coiled-coil protein 2-like [Phycodurus eques]XP_061541282.1 ciliary rootlet coiled-coil protein 2-like [Phycodurus eques]
MTRDEVERVWRERLQRCQRQLKAKEDEMGRQSQYFDNFKHQFHHKLSLARNREESLQKRIYTLEKQLLDMTVSAATDVAVLSAVRIAPRIKTHWEEHGRLPGAREEGEGEEEKIEGKRRKWLPNNGGEKDGRQEGDKGPTENKRSTEDDNQNSNEVRLQALIVTLQEDLRVLLEREESGVTEHRRLIEQLQEAQENSLFLCCKVEEMKVELQQLNLSESGLAKDVEELRVENSSLQLDLKDLTKKTSSQSSAISVDVCAVASNADTSVHHAEGSSEKVLDKQDVIAAVCQQAAAGSSNSATQAPVFTAKHGALHLSKNDSPSIFPRLSLQTLSLASETIEEWGSAGSFNVEDTHSKEPEALRDAYRSSGLGEDLECLGEQCEHLEAALQHSKHQLQAMAQENAQLKVQLGNQGAEKQESFLHMFSATSTSHGADACQSPPAQDDVTTHDGLLQALNQEKRALAFRIEELMAHIELNEEEMKSERSRLRKNILCMEEDKAKLEQEKQEQGCLITELTRKIEDDHTTIMELRQSLDERVDCNEQKNMACGSLLQTEKATRISGRCQGNNPDKYLDSLIESRVTEEGGVHLVSSQPPENNRTYLKPLCSSPRHRLVKSHSDQVEQVTNSIQNLKAEQEQLYSCVLPLRKEEREVSLSVQTQTEEKRHLTRIIWALKEEKDGISRSLDGLQQEREQIIRVVSGLKAVQVRLSKSVSGLKEKKEKFTECFPALEREKQKLLESLSSGKEEVKQMAQTVQHLEREKDQLSQTVLSLKLTDSLQESTDKKQPCHHLQGECERLLKAINSLTDEKGRIEPSIRHLKEEEAQIIALLQSQREPMFDQHNDPHSQTQESASHCWMSENRKTKDKDKKNKTTSLIANSKQELSDLGREIEVARRELNKSQEEPDKTYAGTAELHVQLSQSEAGRENAERQTDMDVVPLKAKLSCLVLKCQERNSLLAQMTQVLRGHRDVDSTLTQRADELLRDAALLEYTAAFAPGSFAKSQDCSPTSGSGHTRNDSDKESRECREQMRTKHPFSEESTTNDPECNCDVTCAPTVRRKQNANSPVQIVQEHKRVPPSSEPVKEVPSAEQTVLPPLATEPLQRFRDIRPESCPGPSNVSELSRSNLSPVPAISVGRVGGSSRLNSPEIVTNLQEHLQQTLLRSCKAVVSRGMSFSAPASPSLSSQKKLQGLGAIAPPPGPLCSLSTPPKHSTPVTTTSVIRNQPITLFNAVTARRAKMSFAPHLMANRPFKAAMSTASSATNSLINTAASSKTNSTSSSDSNVLTSLRLKRLISPDMAGAEHSASAPLMTSKTTDSDVFMCSDTNLKSIASYTTALSKATAHKADVFSTMMKPNGAAPYACDDLEFTMSKSHSAQRSADGSSNQSQIAPEKMRPSRPKPDAPAEVHTVEVVKQVGKSSLLIGWERPPLDDLGCSHGTFVYGYRVFLGGAFYKSVMSSACTKCVLENVNLTYPVEIGVQTLGSNGLSSNRVTTVYMPQVGEGLL